MTEEFQFLWLDGNVFALADEDPNELHLQFIGTRPNYSFDVVVVSIMVVGKVIYRSIMSFRLLFPLFMR